jgi:hypothetical protein
MRNPIVPVFGYYEVDGITGGLAVKEPEKKPK